MFCLALFMGAIVIVMIKSFKVENDDSVRTDVVVEAHEIEGRATRCAHRIGHEFGLSPPTILELKKALVYTLREWLGDSRPEEAAMEFAVSAVERLQKLDETPRVRGAGKDESIKWIAGVVAESLVVDNPEDTRPMEDDEMGGIQKKVVTAKGSAS